MARGPRVKGGRPGSYGELDLPTDMIGTSEDWGVSKPDIAFFHAVARVVPRAPD